MREESSRIRRRGYRKLLVASAAGIAGATIIQANCGGGGPIVGNLRLPDCDAGQQVPPYCSTEDGGLDGGSDGGS